MALAKSFEFDARPGCLSVFAHKVCHLVRRIGLLSRDSYLLQGLQSADKTKMH